MARSWTPRIAALSALIAFAAPAVSKEAADTVGTLTLDGLSFVSFGDQEVIPIPSGATIRFRFGARAADGSVPFTIRPGDVAIPPLPSSSGTLEYRLGAPASGSLRPAEDGRVMAFTATIHATLTPSGGEGGTMVYTLPFSTESASATNVAKTHAVAVTGMRLVEGSWYVQLVGATVNRENAYPKPGAAVYTVLSGRFDRIP